MRNADQPARISLPDCSTFVAFFTLIYGVWAYIRVSLAVPAAVVESLQGPRLDQAQQAASRRPQGREFCCCSFFSSRCISSSERSRRRFHFSRMRARGTEAFITHAISLAIGFVTGTLVGPIGAIAVCLFYFDERVRREGFDIEWMMTKIAPVPTLAPRDAATDVTPPAERRSCRTVKGLRREVDPVKLKASVSRKIHLTGISACFLLPAVPALALRQSSLAEYTAHLESLRALVERCQASASACDAAQVGGDDQVTLQSLGSSANVNQFEARYDWLRNTLQGSRRSQPNSRDRDLARGCEPSRRRAARRHGPAGRASGFAEARHHADSSLAIRNL